MYHKKPINSGASEMDLTTMCLACHLKRCYLIAFLTSPWAPPWEGKMRRGRSPTPTLSTSSSILSKAKQSQDLKKQQHDISWSFSRIRKFSPKSKKQYLKCLKGRGLRQPSSARLLEMGMRSFWMIGMTCCHYQLRIRELTCYAWPFYPGQQGSIFPWLRVFKVCIA